MTVSASRTLFRRILYWGIPPILLYLVFLQVNVGHLTDLAFSANAPLVLASILLVSVKVLAGGTRWHVLTSHLGCTSMNLRGSIAEYWTSLLVAAVAPGTIGSDIYRVLIGGKQTGRYLAGACVIAIEKAMSLLCYCAVLACLYPFLTLDSPHDMIPNLLSMIYIALLVMAALLSILVLTRYTPLLRHVTDVLARKTLTLAEGAATKIGHPWPGSRQASRIAGRLFVDLIRPRLALRTLSLTLVILLVGAVQLQWIFYALGHGLPFIVHLFMSPLILIIYALPLTPAGLGVRETTFVLAYGVFGVPSEVSLLASFCSFLGLVFVSAIGAAIAMSHGNRAFSTTRSPFLSVKRTRRNGGHP